MSWFSKWLFGVDLDEEAARGADLDKKIAEQQRRAFERGKWTREEYEAAQERLRRSAAETANPKEQVKEAFAAGAREGLEGVASTVGGAIQTAGATAASVLPWWAWVVLAVVAFGWLGPMVVALWGRK